MVRARTVWKQTVRHRRHILRYPNTFETAENPTEITQDTFETAKNYGNNTLRQRGKHRNLTRLFYPHTVRGRTH